MRSWITQLKPTSARNSSGEDVVMFARTFVHQKGKKSLTDGRIADAIGKRSSLDYLDYLFQLKVINFWASYQLMRPSLSLNESWCLFLFLEAYLQKKFSKFFSLDALNYMGS